MVELWDVLDKNGNKTGQLHERGKPLNNGEYVLAVQIWITNKSGEFLISKRAHNIDFWPGLWHTTGGAAIAGEDSLSAALRETKEELGVDLKAANGQLFKRFGAPSMKYPGNVLIDTWLFYQDVDISTLTFDFDEICDAMWASKEKIKQIIDEGAFAPLSRSYHYLWELFDFAEKNR